jgi:cell division septum initiation protein DivIVA
MNEYVLFMLQLILLGATGLLYFSFKRAQSKAKTGGLQAEEIVELQTAMNELLDELQELATKANLQIEDANAQASQFRKEIDQRIEKLEQLQREFAQVDKIETRAQPEIAQPIKPNKPALLRAYEANMSPKEEEPGEIGRGELELLQRLQNWQKN